MKKDKLQDSFCCISIAMLIGGVACAALGQWWLLIIAIFMMVFSLWWMATASTSIEAQAGSCPIILNGPLEWIDTRFKENAVIPLKDTKEIAPGKIIPNSEWSTYVEKAKETVRGRVAKIDEDELNKFTVFSLVKKINALLDKKLGFYMQGKLICERHRKDLEDEDKEGAEHPYKEVIFYSAIPFSQVFTKRPSAITLDNYPDQDGIDVKIKTFEVAMIGMPMIQSTIPFIFVMPTLAHAEELIDKLLKSDEEQDPLEKDTKLPVSQNELVILAQNAALNQKRFENATRDAHVTELESDVQKERGLREILQNKNEHLTRKSLNERLAERQQMKSIQKVKPGFSIGTLIGLSFFFLLVGLIFGYGLRMTFGG